MNTPPRRTARHLVATLAAAALSCAWAALAHQAPPAPQAAPRPLTCPDGSARVCTPHGCYCI